MRQLLVGLCLVLSLVLPVATRADLLSSGTVVFEQEPSEPLPVRTWVLSAVLGGEAWNKFPERGHVNLSNWRFEYGPEPIYIIGMARTDGPAWEEFALPVPINDPVKFPAHGGGTWMTPGVLQSLTLQTSLAAYCCWYSGCPTTAVPTYDHSGNPGVYQGCNPYGCCPLNQFGEFACPQRTMFENPTNFPVDGNGNITLIDAHGGATAQFVGRLVEPLFIRLPGEPFSKLTQVVIYFSWARPGVYFGLDEEPGEIVPVTYFHRYSTQNQADFLGFVMNVRITHFASADVPWASRGFVDAADLGSVAAYQGKKACYGHSFDVPSECSPGGSQYPPFLSWGSDLNASGAIDAGDLSVWAYENELADCESSKAVSEEERTENILAWFGMIYSGTEVLQGVEIPRVVIVNQASMNRAILDPYGYRSRTASTVREESWSRMKAVYR